MKIILQTPGVNARQPLQDYVTLHVGKLETFYHRIEESRVCLKIDPSSTRDNKVCEIRLVVPGNDLFASRSSDTFENAIHQTIDALRHQLQRLKESRDEKPAPAA